MFKRVGPQKEDYFFTRVGVEIAFCLQLLHAEWLNANNTVVRVEERLYEE